MHAAGIHPQTQIDAATTIISGCWRQPGVRNADMHEPFHGGEFRRSNAWGRPWGRWHLLGEVVEDICEALADQNGVQ